MNFFEEFEQLRLKTPRLAIINVKQENAEYCTHADMNKNCYLLFAANFNEDCMYGSIIIKCRDTQDCSNMESCELCFECVDCDGCYNCNYCQDLRNSSDCEYCFDCVGCRNCFGCVGLRQKEYYVFNQPVAKEEYKKIVSEWKQKGYEAILEEFEKLQYRVPRRDLHLTKSENSLGDFITNSKNCYECFNVHNCEDCMYLTDCWNTKDTLDGMFSEGSELCYECFSFGLGTYNCNFSSYVRVSTDLEYCELCFSCKNCFGCVGLQGKQYYILNRPYSKEEYSKKVTEIKAAMKADGTYGDIPPTTYKVEDTALVMNVV